MLFLLLLQFNSPFKIKEKNKPILFYNLLSLFKGQNKIIKTTQVGKLPLEIISTKVIKHGDNAPTQHLIVVGFPFKVLRYTMETYTTTHDWCLLVKCLLHKSVSDLWPSVPSF